MAFSCIRVVCVRFEAFIKWLLCCRLPVIDRRMILWIIVTVSFFFLRWKSARFCNNSNQRSNFLNNVRFAWLYARFSMLKQENVRSGLVTVLQLVIHHWRFVIRKNAQTTCAPRKMCVRPQDKPIPMRISSTNVVAFVSTRNCFYHNDQFWIVEFSYFIVQATFGHLRFLHCYRLTACHSFGVNFFFSPHCFVGLAWLSMASAKWIDYGEL